MDWSIFTKKSFLYTFGIVFICLYILFQLIRTLSSVPILLLVSAVIAYYYNNNFNTYNLAAASSNSDSNGSSMS